jgi:hypothetical protein
VTDFASLGMKIDSTQVKQGVTELDRLTAAGARAEAATLGMGKGSKAAAVAASEMAASAQLSARAAVGVSAGFGAATNAVRGNTVAMRESLVVGRELLSGNLTRLPGSLSILAQQFSTSGKSASGFASQILQSFGIIKKVTDTELAGEAAAAAASADAVRAVASRAAANVTAADTEVALAQAAIKTAATTEALAAAQAELATAHEAVTAAAAEATVAEVALMDAEARAVAAGEASAKASSTGFTLLGGSLLGIAAAAAVAYGAFKAFQIQVSDSGELDKFAEGLRLTDGQIEKAGGKVKYLADRTREISGLTVSMGDVVRGVWKTIADHSGLDNSLNGLKKFFIDNMKGLLRAGVDTFATLYGDIVGTYRAVIVIWQNFPAALGDVFIQGVNLALGAINKLISGSVEGVNSFIDKVNGTLGTSIGKLAAPQIQTLTNQYAGAAKRVITAFSTEVDKATAEARKKANDVVAETEKNILDAAKKRLQAESDSNKPAKEKNQSDHGLAEALAELDAQIAGQYRLGEEGGGGGEEGGGGEGR